ncbi:MAG: hypothetical protein N2258_06600, partial [Brevinematales bacterium]|nr:hypothetical protein [Brevinematales bacterium]
MKIMDIISQKVSLESLNEKRENSKTNLKLINSIHRKSDSVNIQRNKNEISSILQLQDEFNKNITSLNGFIEMDEKINEFQKLPLNMKDFEKLSRELSAFSKSVKFNGENIISYLNTDVKNEQSLYTLKMNLSKEIENLKNVVAKERKAIATYLIKSENRDSLAGFSSEEVVKNISQLLNEKNVATIYKMKNNSNRLLS